ncbi:YlaI family protein [Salirhabdus euzebyi]|nr:YlaI family protein [Salirhabdus euzebyi]
MDVICMTCQKAYTIDSKDPQYTKLKRGLTKLYICTNCNQSIQGEASRTKQINPHDLDPHQKALNFK